MTIKVAINGFGRIGRCILRAIFESNLQDQVQVVAINDLSDKKTNAHLLQYDTTHGRFGAEVRVEGDYLLINRNSILLTAHRDPTQLPWGDLGVDVVFECTGRFTSREDAAQHLKAGAKKVLISAPGKEVDATIVYGVNHKTLRPEHLVISNASCTTNCLAPAAKVMQETVGIVTGLMNTVHAYTNDQCLVDSTHEDLARARAAGYSMIPTKTGAAQAVGLVLPELSGKLDGFAIRVPIINVSVVDFTFHAARKTSVEEVNNAIIAASKGELAGVLSTNELPLVSIDFNHNPSSSIVDLKHTRVQGEIVKLLIWYDNEWGFSNRMVDVARALMQVK
jgi:glyceraldehyde 3-phosphate dehydrogenase